MGNHDMSQYEKMTKTPMLPLLIRLSIPTIISMLITNVYNLVDTAFVGQLGNSASGAVGVVFGFMSIIQAVGFMFGQGSGSIISRALGNQDTDNASTTASTGFFGVLFFGAVISVCGFLFLDPLVKFLGSTDTIAPYAKTYISYILAAAPFMTATFFLNNVLRYEGKAMLGMIGMMIGAVLNIGGDALFMFGLDMGIAGAGLSTALSQTIGFMILLSMFFRGKTQSKISIRNASFSIFLVLNIMATGFPSLLRQGLNSITTMLLNSQSSVYGDEAVAAMSIVSRIAFFMTSVALGIGQGFQPISGFNYGAKKYTRLRQAYRLTFILSEGVMILAAAFVLIYSNDLIGIFRDDETVIEIGTRALQLQCIAMVFLPLGMVTEMLFQSTGKRFGAAVLSSLRNGLFFIPALLILPGLRGLYGIQEAQPAAFLLAFIPALFFMLSFFRKLPKDEESGG
ncbi:MAG: MATE family efflux transporter [Oscillospiraceae bacterium]|nr:MATE family efflux transporter [Oscillospiraceae bacterium]